MELELGFKLGGKRLLGPNGEEPRLQVLTVKSEPRLLRPKEQMENEKSNV